MPTPMMVPTRALSSSFNSSLESASAIADAAIERWMKRSIFFCSFLRRRIGVEPFDLAGDAAVVGRGVEVGDRRDSRFTRGEPVPIGGHVETER